MSKPYGVGLAVADGAVVFRVRRPSDTEDRIWDAVEAAIAAGWTPTQFIAEARDAWAEKLRDDARAADEEFVKGTR